MKLIKNIIESYKHIPYTLKHWFYLNKLAYKYGGIVFPFHDMDKVIMYLIFPFLGTKMINKIHRKYSSHHINKYKTNFFEAVFDWESARYTKPDKPLNARETCLKYYPEYYSEVSPILDLYNL